MSAVAVPFAGMLSEPIRQVLIVGVEYRLEVRQFDSRQQHYRKQEWHTQLNRPSRPQQ